MSDDLTFRDRIALELLKQMFAANIAYSFNNLSSTHNYVKTGAIKQITIALESAYEVADIMRKVRLKEHE